MYLFQLTNPKGHVIDIGTQRITSTFEEAMEYARAQHGIKEWTYKGKFKFVPRYTPTKATILLVKEPYFAPDGEAQMPRIGQNLKVGKDWSTYQKRQSEKEFKALERRRLFRAIRKRDRVCRYCLKAPATTVDHIIPQSHGGTDDISNLVGACADCNTKKSDKTLEASGLVLHKRALSLFYIRVKASEQLRTIAKHVDPLFP